MANAEDLVRAYVEAGYAKIHLDCSMACAGDDPPLTDAVVAQRAARLARVAEEAAVATFGHSDLVYVVGTEVPVPGGAHEAIHDLTPTSADAARATLAAHREAFSSAGVGEAFDRVVALVVQPGVEFDAQHVVDYDRERTARLRQVVDDLDAPRDDRARGPLHRLPDSRRLTQLVEDHWAVLKVGPGLTFALREALFALASIENELVPAGDRSNLVDVVDQVMVDRPEMVGGLLRGRRPREGPRAALQLLRPASLLLAGSGDRRRARAVAGQPAQGTGSRCRCSAPTCPSSTLASAPATWSPSPPRSPSTGSATCCVATPQPARTTPARSTT